MQKKVTVMAFFAIAAVILAMPVMAQQIGDVGDLSSNTSASTGGLFKNDVDYFVNYHKFANVLKDDAKWFGFVSGKSNVGGVADLGYATNLGSLYLGIWYRGNVVRLLSTTETHTLTPTYNDKLEILEQTVESTTYSAQQWLDSANKFEFLIGVAGQGIKVGFFESYATDQNPAAANRAVTVTDYQDGRKDFANATVLYKNNQGWLRPYLGWGTNLAIGDMNLMPFVDLGLTIYDNSLVDNYESYTEVNGNKQSVTNNVGAGRNNGVLTPYATVGAKLDLAKKDTSVTQLSLKYDFSLNLYNNDYSASGLSGDAVAGTVSWNAGYVDRETHYADSTQTETSLNVSFSEQTSISNTITLGCQITGEPFENFKLGFSAGVPVSFSSSSTNPYSRNIGKTVVKYNYDNPGYVKETETLTYNAKTENSNFSVGLNLGLGAQYKLVPDRFAINAGIKASPLSWSYNTAKTIPNSSGVITTVKTTQDDGSVTTNEKTVTLPNTADSVIVTDSWAQWTATLYGGFVFNFSPKAALDLGIAYGNANYFNLQLDLVNVIFTFKF